MLSDCANLTPKMGCQINDTPKWCQGNTHGSVIRDFNGGIETPDMKIWGVILNLNF